MKWGKGQWMLKVLHGTTDANKEALYFIFYCLLYMLYFAFARASGFMNF